MNELARADGVLLLLCRS